MTTTRKPRQTRKKVATQAPDQPVSVEAEPGEPISTEPELASSGPAYSESPHGEARGWSKVHGDQNVPADSEALNLTGQEQARHLDPRVDNEAADQFREEPEPAPPGPAFLKSPHVPDSEA